MEDLGTTFTMLPNKTYAWVAEAFAHTMDATLRGKDGAHTLLPVYHYAECTKE